MFELGVETKEISVQEALASFNRQGLADKFSKLFISFMRHYKSNQYTIEDLYKKAGKHKRSIAFLKVFDVVYLEYVEEKRKNGCIDFEDMIADAISHIGTSKYKYGSRHKYKYIFVDEFQDISAGRSRLVNILRKQVAESIVTVVGDDWQAINRFAGGDISIIQNFEKIFGISERVNLDYTFRFNSTVSSIATKFITKNPKQLQKTIKTIKSSGKPSLYIYWYQSQDEIDSYVEKVVSIIDKNDTSHKSAIKILGRYGFRKPGNLLSIQKKYKGRFEITYSTAHGSKGLEADYIILVGMESGRMGFPSRIQDDPLLSLVIPDTDDYPDAEERRLFYVALTRTKNKIFFIADFYQQSVFIKEVVADNDTDIHHLNFKDADPESCLECKNGLLVKRKDGFYGCSNYPLCKYTQSIKCCPVCKIFEMKKDLKRKVAVCRDARCDGQIRLCPKCNDYLIQRKGKFGKFLGCEGFPECDYTENYL